jgi:2-keto-3-deoxy-L-rhamnonate aldolase RhmA
MAASRTALTIASVVSCAILATTVVSTQSPQATSPALYNTVKQKLAEGRQVVGATVWIPDPEVYCAIANAGFDFTWIEMQHSPIGFPDVARMLFACRGAAAIPFVRVSGASESDIQKATDAGALGIIVPLVDTVEKIQEAVRYAKYPPIGRRSQGSGQYGALWGPTYRKTANDNIMIVAMIESPEGAAIADKIAAVPGVDVVFVASTDLGSFSGLSQGQPEYEAMVTRTRDAIQKAGRKVGGPLAWKSRPGYHFFQGPSEMGYLRCGARVTLGLQPTGCPTTGKAEIEGTEAR